jgi:hypothetical protein
MVELSDACGDARSPWGGGDAETDDHVPTSRRPLEKCYWLRLLILVVVAVAQRRLGPSSSATTSAVDRALPTSEGLGALLEPAHDRSAASADDESHLVRTA